MTQANQGAQYLKIVETTIPENDGTPRTLASLLVASTNTDIVNGAATNEVLTTEEVRRVVGWYIGKKKTDGTTAVPTFSYSGESSATRVQVVAEGAGFGPNDFGPAPCGAGSATQGIYFVSGDANDIEDVPIMVWLK